MITSKKELQFYILADRMMNRGCFKYTLKTRILSFIYPDYIMDFLEAMRKTDYYLYKSKKTLIYKIPYLYYWRKFSKLSIQLSITLPPQCCGYGLVLHHHGTIVCGSTNRIGNFALINTSTCIEGCNSQIGDFFFMGACSTIAKKVSLGNNVKLASGSKCNKSYEQEDIVLAGQPASIVKANCNNWVDEYQDVWPERFENVKKLKEKLLIK